MQERRLTWKKQTIKLPTDGQSCKSYDDLCLKKNPLEPLPSSDTAKRILTPPGKQVWTTPPPPTHAFQVKQFGLLEQNLVLPSEEQVHQFSISAILGFRPSTVTRGQTVSVFAAFCQSNPVTKQILSQVRQLGQFFVAQSSSNGPVDHISIQRPFYQVTACSGDR